MKNSSMYRLVFSIYSRDKGEFVKEDSMYLSSKQIAIDTVKSIYESVYYRDAIKTPFNSKRISIKWKDDSAIVYLDNTPSLKYSITEVKDRSKDKNHIMYIYSHYIIRNTGSSYSSTDMRFDRVAESNSIECILDGIDNRNAQMVNTINKLNKLRTFSS